MDIKIKDTLISNLRNGSREAFNGLFRYYYPRLMAYVSSIIEDGIAEDIVQDVFLYVWENRKKLSFEKGFDSYLFQSAYTRCLDYFKRSKTKEKYNQQTFSEYIEQYHTLIKEDCQTMEELYAKDFYERLYELLDKIPSERRSVFILTYMRGMKGKEVSKQLSISQRTVESHIYLTIKYLKKKMSKKDFYLFCFFFVYYYFCHQV